MKDIKEIIASNIIYLRKENKLTQAELAEKLNYSDKAVSKWERAESVPDIEILKNLAQMFGVTVDFLLNENSRESVEKYRVPKEKKANQITITALGVCLVWLAATIIYVYAQLNFQSNLWQAFVWAVPVSMIVLMIFNRMWGKRKYYLYINTLFSWSLLASIYIQFLKYNIWLVFLIGVPVQVVIILWSNIRGELKK